MTAKKNDDRKVKNGGVEFITNQSSSHPKDSMTFLEWNMTRRDLMLQTALASLLLAFPWADSAFAAAPPPPKLSFVRNKTNDGIIGPYGEVRIFNVGGEALPAVISAFDGSALMDLTGRSPFVRFGASTDTTTITLTSSGVQFGAAKPEPWSADIVKKLIAAIVSDRKKARGALLLRSALHMSYPIAIAQTKSKVGSKVATAMAKGSAGYGIGAMKCTVTTVTDVVTKTITDSVAVVLTAEKQYQACVDREITKDPCKAAALVGLGGVCAAGICAAKEFVDIVTGWTTIVYTIGEVMTHQVVSCVLPKPGQWPNPWNLSDNLINTAVPAQPKVAFGAKEIANAQKVISAIIASIGQFGKCLSDAKWSLAQLDTTLNIGGKIVIPYGVSVCLSPACATLLTDYQGIAVELAAAWGAVIPACMALSTDFAAALAGSGFAASSVAAAAALDAASAAAGALMLAFYLLALYYGVVIIAQIFAYRMSDLSLGTTFLADGVCIQHPTFALALIKLLTLSLVPSELVPPIVIP